MNASVLALCLTLIDELSDQEKLETIYERYVEDMFCAAYNVIKDYALAEDAVQEAFVRMACVIKDIDMSYNPQSFAITVTKNIARDMVAKYEREKCLYDSYVGYYEGSSTDTFKEIEQEDIVEKLARFVTTLKPKYLEVFVLRCHYRMQYKEISKLLNVSESTLRKRIQRLKEQMYEYLDGGKY